MLIKSKQIDCSALHAVDLKLQLPINCIFSEKHIIPVRASPGMFSSRVNLYILTGWLCPALVVIVFIRFERN